MEEKDALQEVQEIAVKIDGFFKFLFDRCIQDMDHDSPRDHMVGMPPEEAHAELRGMIWALHLGGHITRKQREAALKRITELRWPTE